MGLPPAAWAGIPVSPYCDFWAVPDTADVRDTIDIYLIARDLYGELIVGLTCDFYSDRGPTDIILDSPDVTDINGFAQARITTTYEPCFSESHLTVEGAGAVIGPITVYWRARAGANDDQLPAPGLHCSSPNPFSRATEIGYAVRTPGRVGVDIFDVVGRKVRALAAGTLPPGYHKAVWDGTDDAGRPMPSGVYYVRMSEGGRSESMSITLLR
jgi:hypothetical protein